MTVFNFNRILAKFNPKKDNKTKKILEIQEMGKRYYLLLIMSIISKLVFGQDDFFPKEERFKFDMSRIFYGGNLGNIQLGEITSIDIAPVAGYRITDKFSAGLGISYKYYSDGQLNFSTSIYGAKVFCSFEVFKYVITHAEGSISSFETKIWDTNNHFPGQTRFAAPAIYIGGGYNQRVGDNSSVSVMILWNLLDYPGSPYSTPDLRIGFTF